MRIFRLVPVWLFLALAACGSSVSAQSGFDARGELETWAERFGPQCTDGITSNRWGRAIREVGFRTFFREIQGCRGSIWYVGWKRGPTFHWHQDREVIEGVVRSEGWRQYGESTIAGPTFLEGQPAAWAFTGPWLPGFGRPDREGFQFETAEFRLATRAECVAAVESIRTRWDETRPGRGSRQAFERNVGEWTRALSDCRPLDGAGIAGDDACEIEQTWWSVRSDAWTHRFVDARVRACDEGGGTVRLYLDLRNPVSWTRSFRFHLFRDTHDGCPDRPADPVSRAVAGGVELSGGEEHSVWSRVPERELVYGFRLCLVDPWDERRAERAEVAERMQPEDVIVSDAGSSEYSGWTEAEREREWYRLVTQGNAAVQRGDTAQGMRHFEEADGAYRKRPEALMNLAALHLKKERYRLALDAFETARTFNVYGQRRGWIDFWQGWTLFKMAEEAQEPGTPETAQRTLPWFRKARQLLEASRSFAKGRSDIHLDQILSAVDELIENQEAILQR